MLRQITVPATNYGSATNNGATMIYIRDIKLLGIIRSTYFILNRFFSISFYGTSTGLNHDRHLGIIFKYVLQ